MDGPANAQTGQHAKGTRLDRALAEAARTGRRNAEVRARAAELLALVRDGKYGRRPTLPPRRSRDPVDPR